MRKLEFHEKKLLKKTNFLVYKPEGGHREAAVTQRYSLVERDDYKNFLEVFLVELKLAEHLKEAVTYIEQGHVRVGPETATDPAFLVTRNMEDFITWVDISKIKKKVMEYNGALDDYDAMI
ncbi:hypothetical protein ACQ4PT_010613 [Festuca glaucescens]